MTRQPTSLGEPPVRPTTQRPALLLERAGWVVGGVALLLALYRLPHGWAAWQAWQQGVPDTYPHEHRDAALSAVGGFANILMVVFLMIALHQAKARPHWRVGGRSRFVLTYVAMLIMLAISVGALVVQMSDGLRASGAP